MKIIYLIRHSAPFVSIYGYDDFKNVSWKEYNKNMILSVKGEENARALCNVKELDGIDDIYASDSFRAIGTAKYLAEKNDLKIKLDSRINERELGVNKISELPDDFSFNSFKDKNLKIKNGESLNEVDKRFNDFLNDILNSDKNKIVLVIHANILMSYLGKVSNLKFNGKEFNINFKGKEIFNGVPTNPLIFKLCFDNNKLIDIQYIK